MPTDPHNSIRADDRVSFVGVACSRLDFSFFLCSSPNEAAAHVKAIDITDRRIDAQGRLITNRIMSCESNLPRWVSAAGLPSACFVAETSVVDPAAKCMVVKSSNMSGSSIVVIEETCTYSQCPRAPLSATLYKQEAKVTAFLPFISSKFESYSLASIQSKSQESMAVVEKLCQRIQQHGALSLLGFGSKPLAAAAASSS